MLDLVTNLKFTKRNLLKKEEKSMSVRCIHDVQFNWVDGGSRRHEIPEYHEWKKGDTLELYDSVPVVKVEPALFNALEDGYEEIPKELLEFVHKVARRINPETHRKNQVEYCFVATDGKNVIAINTEGDNKPNLKSRLNLRHDQFVIGDLAPDMEVLECTFTPEEYDVNESLEAYIMASVPEDNIGLTRTEKEMKQIVLEGLYNLSLSENKAEVFYWFVELFPDLNKPVTLAAMTIETMIKEMFSYLRKGWTKDHQYWGSLIVKVAPNDIYKDEWAALVKEFNKKDKVEK
jgi:hypothetical protein